MAKAKHTPGPWSLSNGALVRVNAASHDKGWERPVVVCGVHRIGRLTGKERDGETAANGRLIAAAPDHALIGWAMCVAAGRWEPWGDGKGEFCINGMRHTTELDEFGLPAMTAGMRAAILAARGKPAR